jgi:WD40 repeat protein
VPDVFISYSRRDETFVRRLHDAVSAAGLDSWVDWEDIPPSAEWMAEIHAAIEGSDSFVFVMSEASLSSEICGLELQHAEANGKRIVPVVYKETQPETIPPKLASLNWIYLRDGDDFETGVEKVLSALRTDLEWVRLHTRILGRAIEWDARSEDRSLLLRGSELREAETWLSTPPHDESMAPTEQQIRYVFESRRAAAKRQRYAAIGGAAVVVALAVLSVFALLQRNEAVAQRDEARRQTARAQSQALAAQSAVELDVDPELSLLLAMEAVRRSETDQAVDALRTALSASALRAVYEPHRDFVFDVEVSPTEALVAAVSRDGSASVTSIETGELVYRHPSDAGSPGWGSVRFTPDGRNLVVAGLGVDVEVLEAATGEVVASLPETAASFDVAVSPDGSLLATAGGGFVTLWSVPSGQVVATTPVLEATDSVEFSPDGTTVAAYSGFVYAPDDGVLSSGGPEVYLIDALGSGEVTLLKGGGRFHTITDVDFSPDGRHLITTGTAPEPRLWNVDGGELITTLTGQEAAAFWADFSPEGDRILTATQSGAVYLWDGSGNRIAEVRVHGGEILDAVFSPDGRYAVTAGSDDKLAFLSATSGDLIRELEGHSDWVTAADFATDSTAVVSASRDGELRVWDVSAPPGGATLRGHTDEISSIGFSPATPVLFTEGIEGSIKLWNRASGDIEQDFFGLSFPLRTRFSPGGSRLVSLGSGQDNRVVVVDVESGDQIVNRFDAFAYFNDASFFNEDVVLVGLNGSDDLSDVVVWEGSRRVAGFDAPGGARTVDALRDSERLVVGTGTGELLVKDIYTGETLEDLMGHDGDVSDTRVDDAEARLLSVGSDHVVRAHDLVTYRPLGERRYEVDPNDISQLVVAALSHDGETVVSGVGNTVSLWEASSGRKLHDLRGHRDVMRGLAFSGDDRFVATASNDGTVRVWEVETGRQVAVFRDHSSEVTAVAIDPATGILASGGADGMAFLHPRETYLPADELMDLAERRVTRELSTEELEDFLGE